MKILTSIIKILFIIIFLFLILGYAQILIPVIKSAIVTGYYFYSFLAGSITFLLLWYFFFSSRNGFWSTLEHELTHAVFALIFFKKIHTISASRKSGGHITIEGGNTIIALGPYILPLAAIILLALKFIFPARFELGMNFLIGYTYMFHFTSLIREFHHQQPDIQKSGYLFSFTFMIFWNMFFFIVLLSTIHLSSGQLGKYLVMGFHFSVGLFYSVGKTFLTIFQSL